MKLISKLSLLCAATALLLSACGDNPSESEPDTDSTSTTNIEAEAEELDTSSSTTESSETTRPPETNTTTTTANPTTTVTAPEGTKQIKGIIQEVFNDCSEHLELNKDGKVVRKDAPITCDGGSWILLDGVQIYSASGMTLPEDAFFEHEVNGERPLPGMNVTATAKATGYNNSYTLNCEGCGLTLN